jgi:hypothetical protein
MFNFCSGGRPIRVFCPGETPKDVRNTCKSMNKPVFGRLVSITCGITTPGKKQGPGQRLGPPTIQFCPEVDNPNSEVCDWICTIFHELTHGCQNTRGEGEARDCTAVLYPKSLCSTAPLIKPNPKKCPDANPC